MKEQILRWEITLQNKKKRFGCIEPTLENNNNFFSFNKEGD